MVESVAPRVDADPTVQVDRPVATGNPQVIVDVLAGLPAERALEPHLELALLLLFARGRRDALQRARAHLHGIVLVLQTRVYLDAAETCVNPVLQSLRLLLQMF